MLTLAQAAADAVTEEKVKRSSPHVEHAARSVFFAPLISTV